MSAARLKEVNILKCMSLNFEISYILNLFDTPAVIDAFRLRFSWNSSANYILRVAFERQPYCALCTILLTKLS